jgi:hypothetical protein
MLSVINCPGTNVDCSSKMISGRHTFSLLSVGDIQNRYTSDVVLNQQARVPHGGGMADCLPGGPVAGKPMAVQDAGAYGGTGCRSLWRIRRTSPWRVTL